MPGFDGSGPVGQGSMTGRAMGRCNPAAAESSAGAWSGYGRGMACRRGRGGRGGFAGRGMGMGQGCFQGNTQGFQVDEKESLRAQASQLQESLQAIQKRLDDLEQSDK
ncbi:DUF5320 domain-containing protein [Desulfogranum japonicum]|uniref:DUF5320 domain-containing protein n=1 Tax=Desulfogranum japonicum TaxID=231447 RepID=UPI00040DE9DC|nr:DUF5320 domain-containing protein [Desulfogranum japonicum]